MGTVTQLVKHFRGRVNRRDVSASECKRNGPRDEVDVTAITGIWSAARVAPLPDVAWIRVSLGKGRFPGGGVETLHFGDRPRDLLDHFLTGHELPGLYACRNMMFV
jgi:hypothetical protein